MWMKYAYREFFPNDKICVFPFIHLSRLSIYPELTQLIGVPCHGWDTTFLLKLSFYTTNRHTKHDLAFAQAQHKLQSENCNYYVSTNHEIWRELWKIDKSRAYVSLMYCKFSYLSQPLYEIDININRIRNRLI